MATVVDPTWLRQLHFMVYWGLYGGSSDCGSPGCNRGSVVYAVQPSLQQQRQPPAHAAVAAATTSTIRTGSCSRSSYTGGRCVLIKGQLAGGGPVVVHLLGCRALHPATGPALRTVMLAGSAVHPAIASVHGMRFVPAAAALAPGAVSGVKRPAAAAALGAPAAAAAAAGADWARDEALSWLPAAGRQVPENAPGVEPAQLARTPQQQQQQQHQGVRDLLRHQHQRLTAMAPVTQLATVVAALRAQLQLQPGEGVLAVVCEGSPMGSLESLLGGVHNPFRPNRSWPAYMARRALLRTALEVAGALAHLHSIGLVHGALRPCNVLLVPSNHDRRNFRTKVFGASVRFVQLLGNRNSTANLVAAGDSSKSMDARFQGQGPSVGCCGGGGAGRCSSSPQPHIAATMLSWPEALPSQGGSVFLPYAGSPRMPAADAVAPVAPTSVASAACSSLPSTSNPWWSPSCGAPYSPASFTGRSRPPSRVLAVAEAAFSPSTSAGNHLLDFASSAAVAPGRRRPSGSALIPPLMLAMGSCPGRAVGSTGGAAAATAPPLCRTPSEGQLLGGLSFMRASRRPLRTSYAIPEHLEVEGVEAVAVEGASAAGGIGTGLGPGSAQQRSGVDGGCEGDMDTVPARRSHSDLVLRSGPEVTAAAVRSGKSSLSFTLGAATAVSTGAGAAASCIGGGNVSVVCGGASAPGTPSRLTSLIRSLVFNKPTAGTAALSKQAVPSVLVTPESDAGGGGHSRRVSNARSGAAASSSRASSVALAAAALLSRWPSWLAAASPVSSSVVPEHETADGLWGAESHHHHQQPQQQQQPQRRRGGQAEDKGEEGDEEEEEQVETGNGNGGEKVQGEEEEEEEEGEDAEEEEEEEEEEVAAVLFQRERVGDGGAAPSGPSRSCHGAQSLDSRPAGGASASTATSGGGGGGWRDELFLPPESQQDPCCPVDASHDTWAFGMLMWAMAAGEPPAEGQLGQSGPQVNSTSGPGPGPVQLLSTLDLDLGIRTPSWPAHCRTHAYLQPLYEACVAKEPGSRPTLAVVLASVLGGGVVVL
ncbi:hypothetical protein VOLCADRAFT_89989 [Volvox carteri f. nagariensis]|uniref:Protein kinase domain-containing protein n=1 Tax=Volvox carteri f. nagariensis TaxID=3068 RepID=D8TT70_VOLCA|nr:uncharacterized protein VOLCADRAFT_89989 [Volvox carteri f. nagariensis]EFJ49143.1 hypothetical protein VOLCADRAFT_89989 [Volvox carteri f. nagariensis]|eukprot:XP_002949591.1 hypothetical protein VOLCADRAFT_89989 [Volvox carteri f. nagariensis]